MIDAERRTSKGSGSTGSGNRKLVFALFVLIAVVALGVRLWSPGPTTETYDENLWLHRTDVFADAIANGHFSEASAGDPALGLTNPTMPGVTTMWAGVVGRQVARASGALGFSAPVAGPSTTSPQVLRAAQGVVSVICVALLVLTMVLLRRLLDTRTALFTGVLLATEPWMVALGHVLHTDAMIAMFSITALCALAWALHGEQRDPIEPTPPPRIRWILAAGALAAGALLTKTNAIGILGPGMALIAWIAWRHRYRGRGRELVRAAGIGLGAVGLVSVVAWPALLAAPVHQVQLMFDASKQVGKTRSRFFHGTIRDFIPQFYVVALAFRLTPLMIGWCLMGLIGGIGDFVRRVRPRRFATGGTPFPRVPTWVLFTPVPYFVVISLSRFGYDRYALVVIPFGVIAGACVASRLTRRIGAARDLSPRVLAVAGSIVLLVLAIAPIRHAPYGTQYVNQLSGGMATAVRWIPVETGQVSSQLDQDLTDILDGACDGVKVANAYPHPAVDHCGEFFDPTDDWDLADADYAMTFRVGEQAPAREWFHPWLREHARVVSTVEVDGVTFGELWDLPPPPKG